MGVIIRTGRWLGPAACWRPPPGQSKIPRPGRPAARPIPRGAAPPTPATRSTAERTPSPDRSPRGKGL